MQIIHSMPAATPPVLPLLQDPIPAAAWPVPWQVRSFRQRIPAGFPSPAADYAEEGLDLNDYD